MRPLATSFVLGIAFLLQVVSIDDASAQSRSSFKVQDIQESGDNYVVTLATNHIGAPSEAKFYGHSKTPAHSTADVQKGVALGSAKLATGAGTVTFTVPKAQLDVLKLAPGQTLHVAGHWPQYGHNWGTSFASHAVSTSFKIPDKSAVANQTAAPEQFPNGMPLLYSRPLWKGAKAAQNGTPADPGTAADPLGGPADIQGLSEGQRNFAEAGSLLESEGKVGIRNKKQLRRAIGLLKAMAKDPTVAEKVLGPGWSIKKGSTYAFSDQYKDNSSLSLAQNEGGLRVREVKKSGQPAQLNYKDPGGVRNGPNDIVMSRTERFTTLGPKANLQEVVRSDSTVNPMKNVKDAGEDPASYLNDAADVPDKRARFQLMYKDPNSTGQPQAVAEISVDNVYAFQAKMGTPKHKQVTFFGMEVDIAHQPVDGSGKQVDYIAGVKGWTAPHKPSDVKHLGNDASIQKTYAAIGKLSDHFSNNGIELRPTVPKYTEGMIRSGVIKANQNNLQKNVLRRDKASFLPAKNPIARVQRVRR